MGLTRAVATALAIGIVALLAPAAGAATLSTGCGGLKKAIETAAADPNHGEADTIVLNGMCDAANLKSSTGVVLPGLSNFSIEGAAGTTSGFDGAGVTEPLLASASFEAVGSLTLRNLTFRHSSGSGGRGSALYLRVHRLTLSGDSFLENTLHGALGAGAFILVNEPKGGCETAGGPPAVTITGSTFRGNTLIDPEVADGAGLWLATPCALPGYVLEDNAFEGNTIELGKEGEALGAGLMFENDSSTLPAPVVQRRNMFDSNRIVGPTSQTRYGGGGEWLEGASLTSVGDRLSRNSIPGADGSGWSWGGGLGLLNTSCNAVTPTESTLENAVVAGNSIGAGTAADLAGAGVYVGCSPSLTHPNHLALLDSTVTDNSVGAGGVAGVGGNPGDQLTLANSIVAADSGGDEIGGFTGAGGSLDASFSDVCAPGGASPLPGAGDICANPMLADAGDPASFDVRETPSSPTVDAGSDALVPGGLTIDHYGAPRIQAARSFLAPCGAGGSTGYTPGPAIVDMGAGELAPLPVPLIAILCPVKVGTSSFSFPAAIQRAAGALVLAFKGLAAGRLTVLATFKLTHTVVHTVRGRRVRTHRTDTVTYAHATHTSAVAGNVALTLKPTRRALAVLRRRKRLKVTLKITFVQPGLLPSTQTHAVTVRYRAPRRR